MPWQRWDNAARTAHIDSSLCKRTVEGIRFGYHPGLPLDSQPISSSKNHPIPSSFHNQVTEDILHGLKTGFILGPFDPSSTEAKITTVSPLGIVDKPPRKIRVIHDISHGKRISKSVNFFIPQDKKYVQYIQTQQITRNETNHVVGV